MARRDHAGASRHETSGTWDPVGELLAGLDAMHPIFVLSSTLIFFVPLLLVVLFWRSFDFHEQRAAASSTRDVLRALTLEVPGTVDEDRFEGAHRERRVEIRARREGYEIAIQGLPTLGSLSGEEALALIKRAARTQEGLAAMPEWQAIAQIFDAHPIRIEKGALHAFAPSGGGVLGAHEEASRLKRLLTRLVEATGIAQIALSLRTRTESETRCPYCHDEFRADHRIIECVRCGVRHHEECYVEFGRCAVFACDTRPGAAISPQGGPIRSFTR